LFNKIKNKISFIVFLVLSFQLVLSINYPNTIAQAATLPNISYSIVGDTTVGNEFTINVNISDITNLYGDSFEFKFDPTLIQVTGISNGNVFDGQVPQSPNKTIDNVNGSVLFTSVLLGDKPGVTASGQTLFTLKVKSLKEGNLSLNTVSDNSVLSLVNSARVKLANASGDVISYNSTKLDVAIIQFSINSFAANLASPQSIGNSITLTTVASGATGTSEYRFTQFDGSKWIVIKDYSTQSSVSWMPTKAGTYTLYADVKNSNGKIVTKSLPYVIAPSITPIINSYTASLASPQVLGKSISLTTTASGGTGTLQYRFTEFDGAKWTTIKDYSTQSSISWIPTKPGNYALYLDVKDSTGKIVTKSLPYVIKTSTV